jgi:hypothetical protein
LPRNENDRFDTAGDFCEGQVLADPFDGRQVVDAVASVLLEPGCDGENVGIENDVFGREAGFLREQVVAALTYGLTPFQRVGLPLFVEGHHDRGSAVLAHQSRLAQKLCFALFQADGVDDALALDALQAGLDHAPLGGVDHDRHARDVRLGSDQTEKRRHRLFRIEHRLVHVDVDHLRAVLDLLARDRQRGGVISGQYQAGEGLRSGDVRALADVHEQGVVADVERLEAGKPQLFRQSGNDARSHAAQRLRDGLDVLRRGSTTAASDVQPAAAPPFAHLACHRVGRVVVLAEGVRQPGVRMAGNVGFGDTG